MPDGLRDLGAPSAWERAWRGSADPTPRGSADPTPSTQATQPVLLTWLFVRARREERTLAAEFGEAWAAYVQRVPGWLPSLRRTSARRG